MTIRIRTMALAVLSVAIAACEIESDGMAVQAVAGPGGVTVTPRSAADQLAVSWSPDAAAWKYYLFRSSNGGSLAFVASLLDSSGGAPPTSYIDTGLVVGPQYCYAVQSAYGDGSTSAMGVQGCSPAAPGGSVPIARGGFGVAYDPAGPAMYVFGGGAGAQLLNDLWDWDGQRWTRMATAVSPSQRSDAAMAWDPSRGVIVVFGGKTSAGSACDTWEFSPAAVAWTQRYSAPSPPCRSAATMSYDGSRHAVVLRGGFGATGQQLSDTWVWNGSAWQLL